MINTLIVEDDYKVAQIHEQFLNNINGIQVVGKLLLAKECKEFIKKNNVELVLVDMYMPDQFGLDLILDLKNEFNHLSFIIITAEQDAKIFEKSLKLGVFYYLIKPVILESFEVVLENYKKQKEAIHSSDSINQNLIDNIFFNQTKIINDLNEDDLPKGINLITLENIISIVKKNKRGFTIEEIGEELGASRTTARRYLEYLVAIKNMKADVEYGVVGRPERKYYYINNID